MSSRVGVLVASFAVGLFGCRNGSGGDSGKGGTGTGAASARGGGAGSGRGGLSLAFDSAGNGFAAMTSSSG